MVTIHTGSLKGKMISQLKLDALVLVDYENHHAVHAVGMCPPPCRPFARTEGGRNYPIFACGGSDVPTEHFAIHAQSDSNMAPFPEDAIDELLSALNGLGVARIGFYVGLERETRFDAALFLREIVEWIERHPNGFSDIYALSPTPHLQFQNPPCEIDRSLVRWAEIEHGAAEENGFRYYFDLTGSDSLTITGVEWLGEGEMLTEWTIPAELSADGMFRVTGIHSSAFSIDEPWAPGTWRDEIRFITLPRYIRQANLRLIAQHFANLDRITTDPENRHLRNREWYREEGDGEGDEEEFEDHLMTAREFFEGVE